MELIVIAGGSDPNDPKWRRLLEKKLAGERETRQAKAQEAGMAFADLDRVRPDVAALASIPAELARELRVLPVKRDGKTLWLATDNPDAEAIQKVKDLTGLRVIPVLCTRDALDEALGLL